MKYIAYELKKLSGVRYLWIFLAVLLAANGVIAFITANRAQPKGITTKEISAFYDLYFENTAELETYYAEMREFQGRQEELFAEAMHNHDYEYQPEKWVSRYAPSTYSDGSLFAALYDSIGTSVNYPSDMQKVIDRAKANLSEFVSMGISPDSYTYRYQERVIGVYESLRDNVRIGVEYSHGWNEYFAYDIVNIFIFIVIIMFGSVIFAQEKVSGFLPIIRTSRRGRTQTALAKLAAMSIISAMVVLLFTLSTFIVFGLELGYSSAYNAIQSLDSFTYCQYIIPIGSYFAISAGVRLLTFLTFSFMLLMLSVFVYNYSVIYAGGLGFFGLNFLFYTLNYINADAPLKNLNFVATAAVNPMFVRFRSINFFSGVWGYVSFMLTVFGILIAVSAAVTMTAFTYRPAVGVGISLFSRLRGKAERKRSEDVRKPRRSRRYTDSLYLHETYKTLLASRLLLLILALLLVKIYFFSDSYRARGSYSDAVYKEYMTMLEGELTDEKRQFISAERETINSALSQYDSMRSAYANESISFEEFREYITEYNYAYSRNEDLKVIEAHRDYLERREAETGVRGWFVYDTGWRRLINTPSDFYLFAALLLTFAGCFADEYSSRSSSGGFAQLLRTTRRGRKNTFRAKLWAALTLPALMSAVFNAVELAVILKNYDTSAVGAPLLSIEQFCNVGGGITIMQYLLLMYSVRTAAAVLLAVLVISISQMTKKSLPTLSLTAAVTLIPALTAYFGFAVAAKFSFLNMLSFTPLVLDSAATDLFGFDFGGVLIFLLAVSVIVAAATITARRSFEK